MWKFQDQDYHEVRKVLQDKINLRAQQELMGHVNEHGVFVRPRRAGAEAALEALKDGHDAFRAARARELEERRRRAEENGELVDGLVPRKDHSIKVEKVYEFQFFDNFEALLQLGQQIQKLIDNFEVVPEELKARYYEQLATGFVDWSFSDYRQFFKAFRKREIDDVEGIASEIDSKTTEEVEAYLRVFCQRFREVKERDQVVLKFQKKDFEQQNLETILEFDHDKAARGEYVVLLQNNHFFNTNSYLALISKAQQKIKQQNNEQRIKEGRDLQLKLDHFLHAQAKQIAQE